MSVYLADQDSGHLRYPHRLSNHPKLWDVPDHRQPNLSHPKRPDLAGFMHIDMVDQHGDVNLCQTPGRANLLKPFLAIVNLPLLHFRVKGLHFAVHRRLSTQFEYDMMTVLNVGIYLL